MVGPILLAFGRALWSQLHYKMLRLTLLPFAVSVLLWGLLLWLGLQPMIDAIQAYFVSHDGFATVGSALSTVGLGALRPVIVPLLVMWMLLPLMILTALLFIGLFAMPAIHAHVSRTYPGLEERRGGTLIGSVWMACSGFMLFLVLWLVTIPLAAIPPFGFLIQPLLWGWLTYRVMAYDALAANADAEERRTLLKAHRLPLVCIGCITGAFGTVPTMFWLGGALSVAFFPLLAALSIWLYLLAFVFTGLWFQHYCLAALVKLRGVPTDALTVPPMKDLNPPPA
jgi:hypothetical protein